MDYSALTKEQLIEELQKANELISQLKKSEELLKQAEATLKEEAIRRRILIDESRDGIVILDENGKVYEANKKYAEMLGYSMEEIYNLHVWDWDAQIPKEFIKEMAKNVDEKGHHFETKHRRKDGSIYDVEISTNGA
ncbi:MAG: PAS domain S-box protein, partial [Candidatus Anstonellales archaeon]